MKILYIHPEHDKSHRKECEIDLVMTQQLVQTWVMALVYWNLSQRRESHGPTDVSSTNTSLVSAPLWLFTCHLAQLKIVFIWPTGWNLWREVGSSCHPFKISHWKYHAYQNYCASLLVSGGTCQLLFTWGSPFFMYNTVQKSTIRLVCGNVIMTIYTFIYLFFLFDHNRHILSVYSNTEGIQKKLRTKLWVEDLSKSKLS